MKEKITNNYKITRKKSLVGNKQRDIIIISPKKIEKISSSKKITIKKSGCSGCSRNRIKKNNG